MFEIVKDSDRAYPDVDIKIPVHETTSSAGADISLPCDVIIQPYGRTIIYTDLKCKLEPGEVLFLAPRSSAGIKKGLMLQNTIGVIDSDYYENPDNDGNIGLALWNTSKLMMSFKAGEKIAQGIVLSYRQCGDVKDETRKGGIGSTD